MSKRGKRIVRIQTYQCENNHFFQEKTHSRWDDSLIEFVVFLYLECLSLNTTVSIMRAWYEDDLLSKRQVLTMIEAVADTIPTLDELDYLLYPKRSGYLAFDGVWFTFKGEQIVLLMAFDPETFDVVGAVWGEDETEKTYEEVMTQAVNKIGAVNIKGVYADGDNGFLAAWKKLLPTVPFQLCVFHKELRMGQFVPIKSIRRSRKMTPQTKHEIKVFQLLFRDVIYAETKNDSVTALERLKRYVDSHEHEQSERFLKAYRSLVRNFKYTLTHFDHSHMKRDNNLLECFNGCLKPRLRLMKGFKKKENLDRYLKLFLTAFRFHPLLESTVAERYGRSPLEVAGVSLPTYYNFLSFLRTEFHLSYQSKIS